ncbi:hypothetical protein BS17DRAFT_784828 [Gyrodon lividus]|nr:hypothetical protein BS17DRAFT_784828 [Gyrodon lividus]
MPVPGQSGTRSIYLFVLLVVSISFFALARLSSVLALLRTIREKNRYDKIGSVGYVSEFMFMSMDMR